MVFALGLKLSKTLRGLVYFVPYLHRGRSPPYNCNTKYTSPLRVFVNFNSKAKTIATFNFSKIESAKLKVARFLPTERKKNNKINKKIQQCSGQPSMDTVDKLINGLIRSIR